MKQIIVFFLLIHLNVAGQDRAELMIDELIGKFRSVNSYIADAVIRPDISFLKILPHKATVYFRQPDQFRMKTEGISILPKQNIDNVFSLLINKDAYDAVADENGDSANVTILTIIPSADTADLMLAKLWVDTDNDIILKARLTTRSNGTIFIEYKYERFLSYGLPDQVIFTIDVKKFKVPKAIAADINTTKQTESEKKQKPGYIYVNLSNYQINKPVPSNVFK